MSIQMRPDYYEILGINVYSDINEINKAYKLMALKWHPDKNNSPEAQQKFQEIQRAREVLSDVRKKQRYDQGLDPDDVEVEAPAPAPTSPMFFFHQQPNVRPWSLGDMVYCRWENPVTKRSCYYKARVVDVLFHEVEAQNYYKIHYMGYNERNDEFISHLNAFHRFKDINDESVLAKNKEFLEESRKYWEVDFIMDKRKRGGKVEYKVYWKGFSLKAASWEPKENLAKCGYSIRAFEEKQKAKMLKELQKKKKESVDGLKKAKKGKAEMKEIQIGKKKESDSGQKKVIAKKGKVGLKGIMKAK